MGRILITRRRDFKILLLVLNWMTILIPEQGNQDLASFNSLIVTPKVSVIISPKRRHILIPQIETIGHNLINLPNPEYSHQYQEQVQSPLDLIQSSSMEHQSDPNRSNLVNQSIQSIHPLIQRSSSLLKINLNSTGIINYARIMDHRAQQIQWLQPGTIMIQLNNEGEELQKQKYQIQGPMNLNISQRISQRIYNIGQDQLENLGDKSLISNQTPQHAIEKQILIKESHIMSMQTPIGTEDILQQTTHSPSPLQESYILSILLHLHLQELPIGGELTYYISEWPMIRADTLINRGIKAYWLYKVCPEMLTGIICIPSQNRSKYSLVAQEDLNQKKLQEDIVEEVLIQDLSWVSPCFAIPKAEQGKWRKITNCSILNKFLRATHFIMEDMTTLRQIIQDKDFMIKIDLLVTFYIIQIDPIFRPFLRFHHNNHFVRHKAICFGVKHVPVFGWKLSEKKSILEPQQTTEFLGWEICTQTDEIRMREDRRQKIMQQINRWIKIAQKQTLMKVKALASFIEIYCWRKKIVENKPIRVAIHQPQVILTVDASASSWVATLKLQNPEEEIWFQADWSDKWKLSSSNQRETAAVFCALTCSEHFLKSQRVTVPKIERDNSETSFNLNRGAAAVSLQKLIEKILEKVEDLGLQIQSLHVQGIENTTPDSLSRLATTRDYSLQSEVLVEVLSQFQVKPTIDMFSNRRNCKIKRFVSVTQDRWAVTLNFLSMSWKSEIPYLHPPIPLIPATLSKLKRQGVQALLIVPNWPSQPWWPELRSMMSRFMILGESKDLLIPGRRMKKQKWHPPPGKLIAVWIEETEEKSCLDGFQERKKSFGKSSEDLLMESDPETMISNFISQLQTDQTSDANQANCMTAIAMLFRAQGVPKDKI
ncbi:MAG: putative reverse transcriptase, partial [Streblomastix strix]